MSDVTLYANPLKRRCVFLSATPCRWMCMDQATWPAAQACGEHVEGTRWRTRGFHWRDMSACVEQQSAATQHSFMRRTLYLHGIYTHGRHTRSHCSDALRLRRAAGATLLPSLDARVVTSCALTNRLRMTPHASSAVIVGVWTGSVLLDASD